MENKEQIRNKLIEITKKIGYDTTPEDFCEMLNEIASFLEIDEFDSYSLIE